MYRYVVLCEIEKKERERKKNHGATYCGSYWKKPRTLFFHPKILTSP